MLGGWERGMTGVKASGEGCPKTMTDHVGSLMGSDPLYREGS